ncbi:SGNH/GDSL hydrolase family protein [Streptomyces sp. NBC_00239]|uniref:SGNH/GDSL hydrolase family protein n=1 Tax=Streptomyces sp. NBC_00239 TaxID=2903640 RepID=UPI002E2AF0AA|nr:SGNH/GDSL hydrolase family protein [Streptomyces sp. NBC_00239]
MPMPPGIATVTLTGRYIHPDGTPLQGTVRISAPTLITLSGADSFTAGSALVTLNSSGSFSVTLVATDNAAMQPTGWVYTVTEEMLGFSPRTYGILLPQATPLVDLADIAPANPDDGEYVVIAGPAGRTLLNGTSAPGAGVGANGDFYINTATWTIYGPKASGAWGSGTPLAGGGGGAVASVNGHTGTVVLVASDVGADAAGTAATAASAAQSAAISSASAYTDSAVDNVIALLEADYITDTDPRLSDDRTPALHKSSHAAGGTDELLPADIGAAVATDVTALTSRVTTAEAAITARQRQAVRRGSIPEQSLTDSLYSGAAPTITTAMTTTPSVASPIKHAPPLVTLAGSDVRGDFLFLGATDFAIGASSPDTNYALPTSRYPHAYTTPQNSYAVEITTNAAEIELRFKYMSATTSAYTLSIDGRPLTNTPQLVGGTTVGSGHMLKVAFGSSVFRRIRFDLYNVPFGGLYIPSTATTWRPITARGRMMVLGDSITDGSTYNSGMGIGTWLYRAARMLGITDAWEQGRGSTGYISAGTSATFGNRLAADVVAYPPDLLIIKGGYNDASGSQSAIQAAAAALYSAAKTGLPSTQIVIVGPLSPTASPATSITNTDTTLRTEAATAGLPYISLVTGETRNGAGAVVSTQSPYVTAANVATVIGGDGVHPTDAGHEHLARWMVRALAPILPL